MAYINVVEWGSDQVTDWLKGLDNSMYHYVKSFANNNVRGEQLLNIRPYELEALGMYSIGHQEIVLEAVEHLRNFHYHLDRENLQFLALHVATTSRNLYKRLAYYCDKSKIETEILNDITRTIATIKPLIGWLDRPPFKGHRQFNEIRKRMLRLGLEMATSAQRDRFAENPVDQIRTNAEKLAKLADYIIQDISDPMILQPAALILVTLKKRESDLGFYIMPSYHGIHRVTDVKYNLTAHNSGKIEEGDEIVQINYQTVVGWQYEKVVKQIEKSPPDVLLTLKKRPKHTKIYGQIYMKPYRLPSKKRTMHYRWGDTLPSPRAELLAINDFPLSVPRPLEKQNTEEADSDSSCSDILTPAEPKPCNKELRLLLAKPRPVLQRRNTICGDHISSFKNLGSVFFWGDRRDKSVSFGYGLEITPRPNTCLVEGNHSKFVDFKGFKGSLPEVVSEKNATEISELGKISQDVQKREEQIKGGVSKVVRFDADMKREYDADNTFTFNVDNTIIETFEPIPYVDEDVHSSIDNSNVDHEHILSDESKTETCTKVDRMTADTGIVQAVNTALISKESLKKRLDKSASTPAYGNDSSDDDVPPAIEPRKEFIKKIPPAPPPRPKKSLENTPPSSGFIRPQKATKPDGGNEDNKTKVANVIDLKNKENCQNIAETVNQHGNIQKTTQRVNMEPENPIKIVTPASTKKLPTMKHFLEESFEALELFTPNKTKGLTLKKKNSILAKRRKVSLKLLTVSDIQGHLYRRCKNKNGIIDWLKCYFVLVDTALYGFKAKESMKADCLIFLPGFTVCLANEVHSKSFAFKVYHSSKTFYFAAETQEALNQWMEYIKQATLKGNLVTNAQQDSELKELFTETESSDDELEFGAKSKHEPAFGSSAGNSTNGNSSKTSDNDNTTTTTNKFEKYHLGFGSLKKFTKSNLPFSSNKNNDKKASSDVPIPTAQFRSYRKVQGYAGISAGGNLLSPISSPDTISLISNQDSNIHSPVQNFEKNTTTIQQSFKNEKPESHTQQLEEATTLVVKKRNRTSPCNYIHASNPNLVDFDFQTSKNIDFSIPKINMGNNWGSTDPHTNLQGFMTLKNLMLQKQAEDAKEVYNNRVYLGMEKKEERHLKRKQSKSNSVTDVQGKVTSNENPNKIDKIQSRSLPKTPDYAQSFKPDDEDIIMTRSKEGLKLRDFGYEFISGDDPEEIRKKNETESAWPKRTDKVSPTTSWSKKKGINWMNTDKKLDDEKSNRSGSFKKLKAGKLDNIKTSSEKIFLFKHLNEKDSLKTQTKQLDKTAPLKPVTSYSPMTLPLNKKSTHVFSIQTDNTHGPSNIKKSNTMYNRNDLKENSTSLGEHSRKFSVPERSASYFTKLSFSSTKTPKEKKLLGSPRLHRAIFGKNNNNAENHNDFDDISLSSESKGSTSEMSQTFQKQMSNNSNSLSVSSQQLSTPDYPNMEYPPVFEPETYSLMDPSTSMTLLRRRNNNHSK